MCRLNNPQNWLFDLGMKDLVKGIFLYSALFPGMRFVFAVLLLGFGVGGAAAPALSGKSIVALVNDEPISEYDIDQRLKLKMAGDRRVPELLKKKIRDKSTAARFKKLAVAAKPKSKEDVDKLKGRFVRTLRNEVINSLKSKYKKEVLEELIGERLMLQDAKKLNVVVSDDQVTKQLSVMAGRSKDPKTGKPLSAKQFLGQLGRMGVSASNFKTRVKANLALQRVVYRKYGRQISVGAQEVDRIIATSADPKARQTMEYQLQKVKLTLPKNADQKTVALRLVEADQLRSKFSACTQTPALIKKFANITMQSLGKRTAKQIPNPVRMIVQKANSGEMTPPFVSNGAVELYAICSKRPITSNQKERQKVQAKLKSEELARLRRRYLRDLRQDAFVEYR